MLLTEDARARTPQTYGDSAVMKLLWPTNWQEVCGAITQRIASFKELSRDQSDILFALLYLIIEVCGHGATNKLAIEVWFSGKGIETLEESAYFSDAIAEFLQRCDSWAFKLDFVNNLLTRQFSWYGIRKIKSATPEKALLVDRLCLDYFRLEIKKVEGKS